MHRNILRDAFSTDDAAVSVPLPEQKSIRFQPLGPQHTFDRHVRMGRNKPIGRPLAIHHRV